MSRLKGFSSDVKEKLIKIGLSSSEAICLLTSEELSKLLNINLDEAMKIIKIAKKNSCFSILKFSEYRKMTKCFTTGCKALDELLGGGINLGRVYEFVGEFGTGKTQICHQLCVTVQLKEDFGGIDSNAVYIDTEGTFRPERIIQIATRFNLDPNEVLKRIYVAKIHDFSEQLGSLLQLKDLVKRVNIGVVIVDSLVKYFRVTEFEGKIKAKLYELAKFLSELRRIAEEYNLAIVFTNQVIAVPDSKDKIEVVGDPYVGMYVDYRIKLSKVREAIRRAELIFGRTRVSHCLFKIAEEGILDLGEHKSVNNSP